MAERGLTVGINDDYASIWVDENTSFYYGYEETIGVGEEEEWAFVAKFNHNTTRIGMSQLEKWGNRTDEEPSWYLMVGMALVLKHAEI